MVSWVLPLVVMMGLWSVAGRSLGSRAGGGIFGVGKSKATEVKPEEVGVTFKDVGGADEAIGELREIIEFLKAPQRFTKLGGRIPKGVLLVGPPGTGKTLIAKATAGEAGVHFFETSGSEFVEMFVGVGAARVRDLFEHARAAAPAIVFIDEIDAIGQSRGGGVRLGTNDEREQTLNQLLAEIDGFKTGAENPVIIMAATNRPETLDPALRRAGRFDRQVVLGNPDLQGRLQILRIHSRKITLAPDFDLDRAARITPGFSGADLENVVNEAALLAARRQGDGVTFADFQAAMERVIGGLEQRGRVMNPKERETVAWHECGHAVVATLVASGEPVSKVSIIPRSRGALGYTMQMPKEDRYLLSVEELEARIAVMMGGRAAEQLVLGTVSTGAVDDIQRATELARRMVTEFGMSEKLGSVRYAGQRLQYLGGGGRGGQRHRRGDARDDRPGYKTRTGNHAKTRSEEWRPCLGWWCLGWLQRGRRSGAPLQAVSQTRRTPLLVGLCAGCGWRLRQEVLHHPDLQVHLEIGGRDSAGPRSRTWRGPPGAPAAGSVSPGLSALGDGESTPEIASCPSAGQ
jgi:cell division protease FtsH